MPKWYAVYAHPREEAIAEENLMRQGFRTYWPRYRKRASHARKVQEVAASLFPRYLFVSFDRENPSWRTIRSTRGVAGLVCHGNHPSCVSERLIEEIRSREDESGYVVIGKQIELQEGQRIQLDRKEFEGHEIIFKAQKDSERVVALLSLLGREFEVSVPVATIIPVA